MSVPPDATSARTELTIEIGLAVDADAAELEDATTRLRQDLLELDVDRIDRPSVGAPPEGARAAELVALGGLIVTLARNAVTIASVIRSLQSWLARDRNRTIKLELDGDTLEVSGISSSEQERLIEAWIARHAEG